MNAFVELSLVFAVTLAVSSILRLLKQPLVVGYIFSGIIAGPYVLDILKVGDYVELFSKIGIAILLFIVGIGLNPNVIREVGKAAFVTGVGQVLFTSLFGFAITRLLGFGTVAAFYVAIALTFSSTIIVLKLLSDKGDVGKLYGRVSIGFLLVQDLIATLILLFVSATTSAGSTGAVQTFVMLALKGIAAAAVLALVGHFVIPRLSRFFASSQELLFLFSVAWGIGLAAVFALLGFSIEIGALVAGVMLSLSPFSYEISSRVRPLRDFFIILFFISLGAHMQLAELGGLVLPALMLSAFVLIGNPLIVFVLMNLLGYRRRTGFMAGLTVAQISEFSLILVALGLTVGHVTVEVVSLVTLVGILTIAGSTYLILYSDRMYPRLEWLLKRLELRKVPARERALRKASSDVIIFGYDRVGTDFVQAAEKLGSSYLAVDFNPASIQKLRERGIPHMYGDAEDVEFLQEMEFGKSKLVISSIPDFRTNMLLVKLYRKENQDGIIMALSHDIEQANELYAAGASYVFMPHYLGASYAASMIARHGFDAAEFERERRLHQNRLGKRDTR